MPPTVQHSYATTWLCLVAVTMVAATCLQATSSPLPSRDMITLWKVTVMGPAWISEKDWQ